jgi:hypothetical protein
MVISQAFSFWKKNEINALYGPNKLGFRREFSIQNFTVDQLRQAHVQIAHDRRVGIWL